MALHSPSGCCFNVWSPLLWAFPSHPLQGEEIRGREEMGGNLRGDLSHVKGRLSPLGGVSEPPEGRSEPLWGCLGHLGGGLSPLGGCLSPFGGVWTTLERY